MAEPLENLEHITGETDEQLDFMLHMLAKGKPFIFLVGNTIVLTDKDGGPEKVIRVEFHSNLDYTEEAQLSYAQYLLQVAVQGLELPASNELSDEDIAKLLNS